MKKIAAGLLALFVTSMLTIVFNVVPVAAYKLTIVSGTDTMWWDGTDWQAAVACWVHPSWPTIEGATWIWRTYQTDPAWEYDNVPSHVDGDYWTFRRTFTIPEDAYDVTGTLVTITADNAFEIYINEVLTGEDGPLCKDGPDTLQWKSVETYHDFYPKPGENVIEIHAVNFFRSGTYSTNPVGLIYKVIINYEVPLKVNIDIKPGSFPNSICLNDQGLLPVAILGNEAFDVHSICPDKGIYLGGARVAERGNPKRPKLAYSFEDVNNDGYIDLIAFFSVQELVTAGALTPDTTELKLEAYLCDGTPICGTDLVRVVPP